MEAKKSSLRVIFLGTPDFAVASLKALVDSGFNVVAVVTAPDKPAGRGMHLQHSAVKAYALSKELPVLQPEKLKSPDFLETLRSYQADLQVVVAFRMLPELVWDMPPMGTINVHASLLPQYRGAAPINWAIINGESHTGVTTFKLKHEIDTGDILLQKEVAILPEDNIGSLYTKLMHEGAALLVTTVQGLEANSIAERPQSIVSDLRSAPKIFKEDCLIDFSRPAKQVHNLIRGLSPRPTAYTILDDKVFKIYTSAYEVTDHNQQAGTYTTDGKSYLKFATQDGWLQALDVQLQGKKRMSIADFLRGYKF